MSGNDDHARMVRLRRNRGHEPIRRETLQDRDRLSFKARGILGYLLSLPEDWETNARRVVAQGGKPGHRGDGRDSVRAGLNELEDAGYLIRHRSHLPDGGWLWVWIYDDDPTDLAARAASLIADPMQTRLDVRLDPSDPIGPDEEYDSGPVGERAGQTMDGLPVYGADAEYVSAGHTMDGLTGDGSPVDGSPVDGSPGHKENYSQESPLPPRVHPADGPPPPAVPAGSAPASGTPAPTSQQRCTHGQIACRTCGTNPRAVSTARARAHQTDDRERSRRCPWCPPSPDENRRWDPRSRITISPYVTCDHTTPHEPIIAQLDAAEAADDRRRRGATPDNPMQTGQPSTSGARRG